MTMKKPWIKFAAAALVVSAIGALAAKGMSSLKKSRYAEIEGEDPELESDLHQEELYEEDALEEDADQGEPFDDEGFEEEPEEVPVEPEDLVF